MGSLSDYLKNAFLEHLLGKSSFSPPTIYIALSTTDPSEDGAGLSEPVGGGYQRVATVGPDFSAVSGGVVTNANVIAFDEATASWGNVSYFALMDAALGGNMLVYGVLNESMQIGSGANVEFAAGELEISVD